VRVLIRVVGLAITLQRLERVALCRGYRDRIRRQGFTGYGRIGVGALDNSAVGPVPFVQDNGVQVLLGAGVEYMTPIGVGIRAEGVTFDQDVQHAQLGLMYRTGRKTEVRKPKLAEVPKP